MFRLLRALIGLVVLAALGFAAVTVPLGDKTLWQHIKAIAGTKESKELVKGVKDKASNVASKVLKDGESNDKLSDKEREALRKLIRERLDDGGESGQPEKGTAEGSKKKVKP